MPSLGISLFFSMFLLEFIITLDSLIFAMSLLSVISLLSVRMFTLLFFSFSMLRYAILIFFDLKLKNPDSNIFMKLYYSFSFHALSMNFVYLYLRIYQYPWIIFNGVHSLIQVVNYINNHHFQASSAIGIFAAFINNNISTLKLLDANELFNILPSMLSLYSSYYNFVVADIIYIFWYVMFRYANNASSRNKWTYAKGVLMRNYNKFPSSLIVVSNKSINLLSKLGDFSIKIFTQPMRRANIPRSDSLLYQYTYEI